MPNWHPTRKARQRLTGWVVQPHVAPAAPCGARP